jgi:hypothetical protein
MGGQIFYALAKGYVWNNCSFYNVCLKFFFADVCQALFASKSEVDEEKLCVGEVMNCKMETKERDCGETEGVEKEAGGMRVENKAHPNLSRQSKERLQVFISQCWFACFC